jgi:transcriptional regulator with XRE-family HTH domain
MKVTPLSVLRLASPGAPRLREIARMMHCSPSAVSQLELGQRVPSLDFLRRYAKAVGVPLSEVRRRVLLASLAHHEEQSRAIRSELREKKARNNQGRKLSTAG